MIKEIKLLSVALVCALTLGGCAQAATGKVDSIPEVAPLTLNLEGGDWGYLTPYTHYSRGPGAYKMKLIFDSMLERGEEGLIPWLAETWAISEDGTEYTFHIKEGVTFHDGTPMTTEDIKFSFDYYKEHPPVNDDLGRSEDDYIEAITLLDKHTLKIKVKTADATLLERFGMARILPKHIWETIEDPTKFDAPEAVIGCGPYTLTAHNKEQGAYKFEAFENYWGPKVSADILQFIPVSDSILAFENGDIDITEITPDILSKYQDDPQYKVVENPAFWGYRILFNMEAKPELLDKDLRQAIAYSIDKDELIEKVARGAAKVASPGYLPLQHSMYNSHVGQYDFNLDKAKELLKGETYEFSLLIGNSNPEVRIGELLQLNLKKVGITLNITSLDGKSRDDAIKSGDYELILYGHGGWGNDPDILRKEFSSHSSNVIGYINSDIDHLSQDQLVTTNVDARKDIIFKLQEVIAEEVPQIPLYHTSGYTVYIPEKYDGWKHVYNHHEVTHNKISYLKD